MIIGARSYELCCRTLHGNTHTHVHAYSHAFKWKLRLGCLSSASTVSIREGKNVIVWHLYFERPFTLFPHLFSALSVKRCPFPSLSAGNCCFNKMPGQSARWCCERQTWQRGADQITSSPVRHPAKSNRGHLVKPLLDFLLFPLQVWTSLYYFQKRLLIKQQRCCSQNKFNCLQFSLLVICCMSENNLWKKKIMMKFLKICQTMTPPPILICGSYCKDGCFKGGNKQMFQPDMPDGVFPKSTALISLAFFANNL